MFFDGEYLVMPVLIAAQIMMAMSFPTWYYLVNQKQL
jgi:hypothetical protein